jgi:hypothetical protein
VNDEERRRMVEAMRESVRVAPPTAAIDANGADVEPEEDERPLDDDGNALRLA